MTTLTFSSILSSELLQNIDAYWRAANYLSVGQNFLHDNPLLKNAAAVVGCQKHVARSLGNLAGSELYFRSSEPRDQNAERTSMRKLARGLSIDGTP